MIAYKALRGPEAGRFVKVDARGTSQTCAECGALVQKDLRIRIHSCPHCKTEVYRDVNAARNILKRAVRVRGAAMRKKNGKTNEERPQGGLRKRRPSLRKPHWNDCGLAAQNSN